MPGRSEDNGDRINVKTATETLEEARAKSQAINQAWQIRAAAMLCAEDDPVQAALALAAATMALAYMTGCSPRDVARENARTAPHGKRWGEIREELAEEIDALG